MKSCRRPKHLRARWFSGTILVLVSCPCTSFRRQRDDRNMHVFGRGTIVCGRTTMRLSL
ncbi:hypothetical protein BCR44DRAFT_1436582 [Catenaria anguillulae PL171]|uniref:Uncharacterized protein n=1 Tax=Catenaria anguillulae PL171 TaxID=765915 RepID=A0A1Y2HKL2_9FUNG|nr:hypothetical protein BCR44DRAFT_1436582 [Catenaria anguillulae PL171]